MKRKITTSFKYRAALLLLILTTIFYTCKKELPKEDQVYTNAKELAMTDDAFFTLLNQFYSLMKRDTLIQDSTNYSYDSSLFYLRGSLNFRYGYANANLTPFQKFEEDISIPTYQENITFNNILGAYRSVSTFILQSYDNCTISGKLIHSINIQRQIVENSDGTYSNRPPLDDGSLPIHISLIIGNTSSSEGSLTSSSTPSHFQSYENYRYCYNGGSCGQKYSTANCVGIEYIPWHDMGSARRSEWKPSEYFPYHDDYYCTTYDYQYGFITGGARALEDAILQLYSTRSSQSGVDPHDPTTYWNSSRMVWGQISNLSSFIYPANAPISGTPIPGDNSFNSSKIFSYNQWSTYLDQNLPCLDFNKLNIFLGYSYDVAQQYTPTGTSFYGFAVYSGYNPFHKSAGSGTPGSVACKLNRSSSNQSYDSYYDHYYWLMYGRLVQKPADQ
ncbi:MAG: hypothetical protein WCO54_06700 [Bacteroidota bacterium]